MVTAEVFDPRDPRVRADPYPVYRAMRDRGSVSHVPSAGIWFVTSHEHCLAVLCDPRFSARQGQQRRLRSGALPVTMLTADPPDHTRLRRAVAPAFGPEAMDRVRGWLWPLVEEAVRRLGRTLRSGGEVDLVVDFAQPLAVRALGGFLGLGEDDLPDFATLGRAVAVNLDPFADPDSDRRAAEHLRELLAKFADHLHARSADPADDALGVLARAHADGALSPGEALAAAGLLVVGGLEPLTDLVANAAAAVLTPGTEPVLAGPRARTVVDEFLRYDAPIQFTARRATEEVELGGRTIPAGDDVVVLLGAANRDPARFADPDRLAPDRRTNPHLSFGAGAHACLGAPLARLFATLIIEALPGHGSGAGSGPVLAAGTTPAVRRPAVVPRGYEHLPVRCPRDQP